MSNVLLGHAGCGGNIVLDLTFMAKIIAPSFSIGLDGVSSLILDITTVSGSERKDPVYYCQKCQDMVELGSIESSIQSTCMVCGLSHRVGDMQYTDSIPCICNTCFDVIQSRLKTTNIVLPDHFDMVIETFGLRRPTLRSKKLSVVLASPIKV